MNPSPHRRLPTLFLAVAAAALSACGGAKNEDSVIDPIRPPAPYQPKDTYASTPAPLGKPPAATFYDPPAAGPIDASVNNWLAAAPAPAASGTSGSGSWTGPQPPTPPAPATPLPPSPPSPPPAPAQPQPVPQAFPSDRPTVIYLSDCQQGADINCVPGIDSNSGTSPTSPKRTLASIDVNTMGAGSKVLFACGGVWTGINTQVTNPNATPTAPLSFDHYVPAWGCKTRPWLKASTSHYHALQFGITGDKTVDGGYVISNLKLDGLGRRNTWGLHFRLGVRNVVMSNLEITGFAKGVLAEQDMSSSITNMALLNSTLTGNLEYGFDGSADNLTLEGNTFTQNNSMSQTFGGALRLYRRGKNLVMKGNTFTENSVNDGKCDSEVVTINGMWDGMLIENNEFKQRNANTSCYGISMYGNGSEQAYFRNVLVTKNRFENMGTYAISATSAPGIKVELNLIVHRLPQYHAGIVIHDRDKGLPQDDDDTGAVVRSNTIVLENAGPASEALVVKEGAGRNVVVASNLIYFGPGSDPLHSCFAHPARSVFLAFDSNLCHHGNGAGSWSSTYPDAYTAAQQNFDRNGMSGDPLFVVIPSSMNGWSDAVRLPVYPRASNNPGMGEEPYIPGGAGLDMGHPTYSTLTDRLGNRRGARPDIGARETADMDWGRIPAKDQPPRLVNSVPPPPPSY